VYTPYNWAILVNLSPGTAYWLSNIPAGTRPTKIR
jgi:hypothetical protein